MENPSIDSTIRCMPGSRVPVQGSPLVRRRVVGRNSFKAEGPKRGSGSVGRSDRDRINFIGTRRMMSTRKTTPWGRSRMKLGDAAVYLGVSPAKLSRIVGRGELPYTVDPLDRRRKLVAVADLKRLREQSLLAEESD